jgi:hypothetical protein
VNPLSLSSFPRLHSRRASRLSELHVFPYQALVPHQMRYHAASERDVTLQLWLLVARPLGNIV